MYRELLSFLLRTRVTRVVRARASTGRGEMKCSSLFVSVAVLAVSWPGTGRFSTVSPMFSVFPHVRGSLRRGLRFPACESCDHLGGRLGRSATKEDVVQLVELFRGGARRPVGRRACGRRH